MVLIYLFIQGISTRVRPSRCFFLVLRYGDIEAFFKSLQRNGGVLQCHGRQDGGVLPKARGAGHYKLETYTLILQQLHGDSFP